MKLKELFEDSDRPFNIFELRSSGEVIELERQLDSMFSSLGFDIAFSSHFIERILGRESVVTKQEILDTFQKLKGKYKQRLLSAKKKGGYEAILKDFDNDLNIVFGIQATGGKPEYKLVNITIKQKKPEDFYANVEGGEILRVGRIK